MCPQHIYPSNATYAHSFINTRDHCVSIWMPCELTAVNNVTRSSGIHTFHITGIRTQTNMPTTFHTYVPFTSTVVYIYTPHYCKHPSKINKLQHIFTALEQSNMCQQQICMSNAINIPYAQMN